MLKGLMIVPYPELERQVRALCEKQEEPRTLELDIRYVKAEELSLQTDLGEYDFFIGRGHTVRILKALLPFRS